MDKNKIKKLVVEKLKECFDPEIPIDLWSLGLIYKIDINNKNSDYFVDIIMSLTTPGCSMGEIMAQDIFSAPGDEIFEYNKNYENNLSRIVGYDIKDELMIDLEMHDAFEKLPNSMNYSLSFTDIILSWDNKNKSFISENNIGLGSINNTQN